MFDRNERHAGASERLFQNLHQTDRKTNIDVIDVRKLQQKCVGPVVKITEVHRTCSENYCSG